MTQTTVKTDQLTELLKRRLALWDAQDSLGGDTAIVLRNTIDTEVTPEIRRLYGLWN